MPLPLPVRALNRAGALAQRTGVAFPSLAPESIVAAARKETGLDDVGPSGFYEASRRCATRSIRRPASARSAGSASGLRR